MDLNSSRKEAYTCQIMYPYMHGLLITVYPWLFIWPLGLVILISRISKAKISRRTPGSWTRRKECRDGFDTSGILVAGDFVCSKPIWDIVAHMVTSVPLPSAGKSQILFTVENHLLTVQAPLKGGLPHADVRHLTLLCLSCGMTPKLSC
jgi:hypothetical protein